MANKLKTRMLALCVIACAAAFELGPSHSFAAQNPCALSNSSWPDAQPACSPYVITPPHIIATFPRWAFARIYELGPIATLTGGSAVVEGAPYALFRAYGAGLASVLWAPPGSRYYARAEVRYWIGSPPPPPTPTPAPADFYLLGSFDDTAVIQCATDWIYGINSDGSVSFRFSRAGTALPEQSAFIGRDPDRTLWFKSGGTPFQREMVYAVFLSTHKVMTLSEPVENSFQGPFGFIYARLGQNLVELRSTPSLQARYARGPIPLKAGQLFGASEVPVSRIGEDGSAWASTPFQVIHEHPNGQVSVIGLSRYPTTITRMPVLLDLHLSPDGSAWIARYDKLIRITKDDRVQVTPVSSLGYYPDVHVAPDGTAWLKTTDDAHALLRLAASN